ncbi:MAG: YbaB/EbfC DNA-binding family [Thermomicrobiales bacterium]|nr:YbaB/EbfC DNA-binding family [Thermomicrobiales bacterium]
MGVNMKMIQQMQTRLETMQRELAETVVEGTAGGGIVTAKVTPLPKKKWARSPVACAFPG